MLERVITAISIMIAIGGMVVAVKATDQTARYQELCLALMDENVRRNPLSRVNRGEVAVVVVIPIGRVKQQEENYRDYLFPESNRVPHYYKGCMDILSRLMERKEWKEPTKDRWETRWAQEAIYLIEDSKVDGYAPLALVELYSLKVDSGIRYKVDLMDERVDREYTYAYCTDFYGKVYEVIDWIVCRPTGRKDARGLKIYKTPAGTRFVIATKAGSPEYLGSTVIEAPVYRGTRKGVGEMCCHEKDSNHR